MVSSSQELQVTLECTLSPQDLYTPRTLKPSLLSECLDSMIEERLRAKLMIYEVMARTGGKEEWDLDLGSLDYDTISITSDRSSKHSDETDVAEGVKPASSMETLADPVGNVMYIIVPGAARSSVESNCPLTYQRSAVVKRFLAACQRLRGVFKECLCVRASAADHQPVSPPTGRSEHVSGTARCSHVERTVILGHIDLTAAMDAIEAIMESTDRDDTASLRMSMEQLLSSGALRPLTDTVVGHLRHLITDHDSFTSAEGPATSVSTSTFPQWRDSDHIYAIVERSLRPFLGQLLNDVLAHLHEAETEDNKPGSPSATSNSYIDIHEETLSLLAAMMTRKIVNDLSSRPNYESGQRSPNRGFLSVGVGKQDSVEGGKVSACSEGKHQTHLNYDGNDYISLVSTVLIQLIRKIEPTTEDTADFTTYHQDLTEIIVSEFCSASGLFINEIYPNSIKIQKICKKMYKELLKNFISKDMVHKLLLYRIPVFSTILTKCLVNELLRLVQKDAETEDGCKLFNFLQRFKLCRKVWTAFKWKRANNVQPFSTEVRKI